MAGSQVTLDVTQRLAGMRERSFRGFLGLRPQQDQGSQMDMCVHPRARLAWQEVGRAQIIGFRKSPLGPGVSRAASRGFEELPCP